jgi:hypothetical protein
MVYCVNQVEESNVIRVLWTVCVAAGVGGCAAFSPNEVAKPSTLTIENAMGDIGAGFVKLKGNLEQNPGLKLGLWPCKVTVSLNVTANADMGGKLVLDTTIKPPAKVVDASITGHAEQTNNSSATRGNSVDIELYSIACLPKDTLGFDKPDKMGLVVAPLEQGTGKAPFANLPP